MEGKGLGGLVMSVTSGRKRVDGRWCLIVVTHKLWIYWPRVFQTTSCIDAIFRTLQSQVLRQDITKRTLRFFFGHRPLSVYLSLRLYHILCTRLNLPGLPTLIYQKLDSGKDIGTSLWSSLWSRTFWHGISYQFGILIHNSDAPPAVLPEAFKWSATCQCVLLSPWRKEAHMSLCTSLARSMQCITLNTCSIFMYGYMECIT